MLESLSLVVHEGTNRAAQWDHRDCGRRFKTRDHADQVTDQDEETERHQKWRKALAVMTDNFPALPVDESLDTLEHVLESAGTFDREARADKQKQDHQKQENEQLHRQRIRDRRGRMLGLDGKCAQQGRHRRGEQMVQDGGKPELFHVELALSRSSKIRA